MIGTAHQVSTPPTNTRSVMFMLSSIATILKKLILNAVSSADLKPNACRISIAVSNAMLVSRPLNIASDITIHMLTSGANSWKAKIVPKSPMLQPSKHHLVLFALCLHVCPHFQLIIVSRWAQSL